MIAVGKIKKSYDRYAQNYDSGAQLQRDLADKLIKAAQDAGGKFSRVLDIGCGTGYLVDKLKATGCDISFGMLNCAKNKIPSARYVQANALVLPFGNACFDLIVSNAAYQWAPDLKNAFREARRALKPRGRFYLTVFGRNTLWQLREACAGINITSGGFPDRDEISSSLRQAGFTIDLIETFIYEKHYRDLWELLGVLKNIGSTPQENKNIKGLGWRRVLQRANDLYFEKFGGRKGLPATYEAFLIKAIPQLIANRGVKI